ncbi:MAG TPA: hypothetical protein VFV29_02260 [Actinomycetota bacterium]|nr:hypothetical protein [Actinomycetota bacterium]
MGSFIAQNTDVNGGVFAAWALFGIAFAAIYIFAAWKIVSKAGYSGALSLLIIVPLVNIVMLFVFAFSDWPVLQEVRRLRATTTSISGGPPMPPMAPPPPA